MTRTETTENKTYNVLINKSRLGTKAICNKGFSGNSSILHHLNFGVNGQNSFSLHLTAYSFDIFLS